MTTKPVLAVDFDDVIAGFNQAFTDHCREHYGTNVPYESIFTYDMELLYGATREEIRRRVLFSHYYHDTIEPIDGAIESLSRLSEHFRLELVTSRCESIKEITLAWKERHIPGLFAAAHFTNGFATLFPERKRTKASLCREIGAVALIDDATAHAVEVVGQVGIPVYLPDRPWNRNADLPEGVTRVYGWQEIERSLLP
jgi:uncharacterized HAD superfamily protein